MIVHIPLVSALTAQDKNSILNDAPYYWPQQQTCTAGSSGGGGGGSGTPVNGIWNSGLQPPYILEQFVIEVLKDIASKKHVPTTDAVTENHVVALVTFAYGEGGGITNQDWWNPWNTGINAPDLIVGGHSTSGVQAFKSFDAGVEAAARVMSGGHPQTRLGKVLTDPNSTVADFFRVLTWYNDVAKLGKYYTPGDLEWATLSMPPPDGEGPDKYYNSYMNDFYPSTVNNWNQKAGLVMRGSSSDPTGKTDPSKLMFHPKGTTSGTLPTGGLSTITDCNGSPAPTGSIAGYLNPLRDIKHSCGGRGGCPGATRNRIDQGVDYWGFGPLYAIGDGVITLVSTNTGWPDGNWVSYRLTAGKAAGKYVYVAEDCVPAPGIQKGTVVHNNTVICNMTNSSPGNEMGWAIPKDNIDNALASSFYIEGHPTSYGVNFSQFMQAIGGPPGDISKSTGGLLGTLPADWPRWP